VFPRYTTSDDLLPHEQNLWIIDEKLTFNRYITSDKKLSAIEHIDIPSGRQPDILLFDHKLIMPPTEQPLSAITIVEFKRPNRDDYTPNDNPVRQCRNLVKDIRTGAFKINGRTISTVAGEKTPAICYIIADFTPSLRELLSDDNDSYIT